MTNRMIHTPGPILAASGTNTNLSQYWSTVITDRVLNVSGWYENDGSSATASELQFQFDTAASGWTIGLRFKYPSSGGTTPQFLEWMDVNLVSHLDLRFNTSTGVFSVTRAGTVLQTGTTVLAQSTEYYIEWQVTIADSGGVSILNIDGVVDAGINSSSLDTRNAGVAASVQRLSFHSNRAGNQVSWKDIYVNDNTGGVDDGFWGPISVVTMRPTAAGNKAQWTPLSSTNVSNVDDTTDDGDTTYNATSTLNQIDSFVMADTGYAAGTVKGVEVVMDARRTDASATARLAPLWRIGSTDYVGSDLIPRSTYLFLRALYRLSPATSAAWTVSELDGAELGYKRTAA